MGTFADRFIYWSWFLQLPMQHTERVLQEAGYMVNRIAIIQTWVYYDELKMYS